MPTGYTAAIKDGIDFNTSKLSEARAALAKLEAMTFEDAAACAAEQFQTETTIRSEGITRDNNLREKYEAMLAQVEAWTPPTEDHQGFQKIMREQIQQSINFDCWTEYYERMTPRLLEPAEWLAKEQVRAMKDVVYHTEEHAKEVERANARTAWVQALRTSLKPAE